MDSGRGGGNGLSCIASSRGWCLVWSGDMKLETAKYLSTFKQYLSENKFVASNRDIRYLGFPTSKQSD